MIAGLLILFNYIIIQLIYNALIDMFEELYQMSEEDKEGIWVSESKFKEIFPDWEEVLEEEDKE